MNLTLMSKSEQTDSRGFTLVETIVVMLIMSVVMMAVMSLFIPAKRSSVVQSDLATVQGSMTVALERMSKDFRNAGFLVDPNVLGPIDSDGYTPGSGTQTVDASIDVITINTRAVSGIFGRVETVPTAPSDSFQLVYDRQGNHFQVDSYAVVIEPVNGTFLGDDSEPGNIYRVLASTSDTVKLGKQNGSALDSLTVDEFSASEAGLILLRVPDDKFAEFTSGTITAEEAIDREIEYRLEGGALIRKVDGQDSYIATQITSARFTIAEDADGDPNTVTIELVGESVAAGNDAVGSAKTNTSQITLALRNI